MKETPITSAETNRGIRRLKVKRELLNTQLECFGIIRAVNKLKIKTSHSLSYDYEKK